MTDVGTLPGCVSSEGAAINNNGEVIGDAASDYSHYGFVFQAGKLKSITQGWRASTAKAINDRGEITGWTSSPTSRNTAYLYGRHGLRLLGTSLKGMEPLPESQGWGINNTGDIVGYASDGDSFLPFIYRCGHMRCLTKISKSAFNEAAFAVNHRGQVVGVTDFWGTGDAVMFVRRKAQRLEQTLSSASGWRLRTANAINEDGWIVGGGFHHRRYHAYLLKAGRVQDLGALPGLPGSEGMALNVRKQVVGSSGTHAFLYQNGIMTDLNDLIPANSGWLLEIANGINDRGQIVGTGLHHGLRRAFVLTPAGAK